MNNKFNQSNQSNIKTEKSIKGKNKYITKFYGPVNEIRQTRPSEQKIERDSETNKPVKQVRQQDRQ